MAPTQVVNAPSARPALRVLPRDEMQALVNRIERAIAESQGEMQEYPDCSRFRCPTLFRYTIPDGRQVAFSIPVELLDADVRAAVWALAQLVESKAV